MDADLKFDIRETIAYPKRWTPKMNPRVPYARYPHMPLGLGNKPFLDTLNHPIVWANARDEKEWLEAHPKEALQIAEHRAATSNVRTNNDTDLENLKDAHKRVEAERDSLEKSQSMILDELEAAKAELAALRSERLKKATDGSSEKLDMRTKAGREAAAKAAQGE
jgi:hypothetical protein